MINTKYTIALVALLMQGIVTAEHMVDVLKSEVAQEEALKIAAAALVVLESEALASVNDLAGNHGVAAQDIAVEKIEEGAADVADLLEVVELITEKSAQ